MLDSLNNLFGRLSDAIRTERRFIDDASHELRTPLAAIKAQIQAIDRKTVRPDTLACLDKIHQGVERATRLVEQLLALARSEAASIPAAAAVIDLAPIARAQVAEIFPQAIYAGVELDFVPDNSPVRADPVDMAVLVRNLLDNAVRYAGSGASVRIETGRGAGNSWIQIEDSGPGMSDDELAHGFARFRRGAHATGTGSGLGLSIVQATAARYGGTVELRCSGALGGLLARVEFPT